MVEACKAKAGWYRTGKGRLIRIVQPSRVSSRWPPKIGPDAIAYKATSATARGVTIYGWLMPDTELRPEWAPKIGDLVCDCKYVHQRIASFPDPEDLDYVILEDGAHCSIRHCLSPVDHDENVHKETLRQWALEKEKWKGAVAHDCESSTDK